MVVTEQNQQLAKRTAAPIAMGDRGVRLTTLEDAFRFAQAVVKSGLAPKGVTTPEQALIAMQAGAELGFSPMRALACVVVVNGRAGIMGDAALAKIHESGVCSRPPVITVEGEGDERRGVVRFQRKDMPEPIEVSFSIADAKRAKLYRKAGPWTDYEDDMLGWRAVARACKKYFGDVLMGLTVAEELRDYPAIDQRPEVPPAEPDPLLAEITDEVTVTAPPSSSILPDEAEMVRMLERLEGAIVSAESLEALNLAWDGAQSFLPSLSAGERTRLDKLYAQNASGFGALVMEK